MGKGDQKSKRGKITNGSYGVRRLKKSAKPVVAEEKPAKAKPEAKPKATKPKAEKAETTDKPKATKTKKTEE